MPALTADAVAGLVTCHREPPARGLLAALSERLPTVLVVDDGMPANAAAELDRHAAECGVEVLHRDRRRGKGHAIAAGVRAVRAGRTALAGVLVVDGDGQHPPDAIPAFLAASGWADLVIGNRFGGGPGMPPVRRLANRTASRALALATGSAVPDSQCGMRLMCRRALDEVPFPGGGMEAETVHLKRCLLAGVPVAWVDIPPLYEGAHSSFRPARDGLAVMRAALAR
ncbi:MAG: glycosyltransferase family 2 protein [Thermoleophilaceae bacterium]|nr:glycosyltransferase family 2 protein [Thermoleophilaceae bacterium]